MEKEIRKAEIRFARYRMLMGSLLGFTLFFLISTFILYIRGWFADDVANNPYLGPPPMMTALLLGFFGAVMGALLSLYSKRWKQFK